MQKIVPHLWFDKEAAEAAAFYVSAFSDSIVTDVVTIHDTPSGDCDVVSFELFGYGFVAISAGPLFRFNPSVSFLVSCRSHEEVDGLWRRLSEGGNVLMPLDSYPFSERYGWTEDRYGLSWQVMHAGGRDTAQRITPTLMFVGDVCGRAEEAIEFYTSVFRDSSIGPILRYGSDDQPDREGTVKHAAFTLEGQRFAAMDSALEHDFGFNEAISLMVNCQTQDEIDYYWDSLTAAPEAEQCGWLKDTYGLSWQVTPLRLEWMLREASQEQAARVTAAFLEMKKFDIAELERAYEGAQTPGAP